MFQSKGEILKVLVNLVSVITGVLTMIVLISQGIEVINKAGVKETLIGIVLLVALVFMGWGLYRRFREQLNLYTILSLAVFVLVIGMILLGIGGIARDVFIGSDRGKIAFVASEGISSSDLNNPNLPRDILLLYLDSDSQSNLKIIRLTQFGRSQSKVADAPAWSPDGKSLAFLSNYSSQTFEIYSLPIPTTNEPSVSFLPNRITYSGESSSSESPAWSPEGKIAFNKRTGGKNQILIWNTDGTVEPLVAREGTNNANPSWSPDGKRIAFHSDRDTGPRFKIYWMDVESKKIEPVTKDKDKFTDEVDPAWSPDGNRIAFTAKRDDAFTIRVAPVSGITVLDIPRIEAAPFCWAPSWSPDGRRLAFVCTSSDKTVFGDIYVADAIANAKPRQITFGKYVYIWRVAWGK